MYDYWPFLVLLSLVCLVFYAIYRVISSEKYEDARDENVNSFSPDSTDFQGQLKQIKLEDYHGLELLNVHYALVNDFQFDLQFVHSVDQGIFLEFRESRWLNIIFNTELGIFELIDANPHELDLEFNLTKMSNYPVWSKFIGNTITEINCSYSEADIFNILSDIKFDFGDHRFYVSFAEEFVNLEKEIEFGHVWIAVFFSAEVFKELRFASERKNSNWL